MTAILEAIRPEARNAPESRIVDVFNRGRDKAGLVPLWVGEGDLPTPSFISDATTRALTGGETFYTYQRGVPELRQALSDYYRRHFDAAVDPERIIVCGSGMQSIHMAMRITSGPGNTVVLHAPCWPNTPASAELNGAALRFVTMDYGPAGWTLDVGALMDACDDTTSAIFINTPSNPTGWVMPLDDMRALLDFARRRGIWIVADEIYARYVYDGQTRAPSFLDIAEPDDRILFCNSFSKNWAMTGWRVGWLVTPPGLGQVCENLVQYNTSGVPAFLQRGCVAALSSEGDAFVADQIERARTGRTIVMEALGGSNRVDIAAPVGSFYAFFAVHGFDDSHALAIRLIDEANVGLAPGNAFGPGGERFMRLCFCRSADDVRTGVARIVDWIGAQKGG
ncbi:MAG: pyridoxal phosphate-dependent aminotransferase [Rhodobiaceae bacterium]|nr:pyridoxal phosphate-dependent aminotransferase [Rhodobiaceae bacterium]